KQAPAYDVIWGLEFRRVLSRSRVRPRSDDPGRAGFSGSPRWKKFWRWRFVRGSSSWASSGGGAQRTYSGVEAVTVRSSQPVRVQIGRASCRGDGEWAAGRGARG